MDNIQEFYTSMPKSVFEVIVTNYFRNMGILSPSVHVEISNLIVDQDDVTIEAELHEEAMN